MGNEIRHIFETYFTGDRLAINTYGDETNLLELSRLFPYIVPFDHPDAYAVLDDEILIVEHFEFDSSNANRKGSQQRQSEAEGIREFQKYETKEKVKVFHSAIDADYTMENYKKNLTRIFEKHYSEIPRYKDTLSGMGIIKPSSKVQTMFFIEDTTIFGNLYDTDGWEPGHQAVIPLLCDFFLDLFEKANDLDCVLCAGNLSSDQYLWYLDHSQINEFKKHEINTAEIQVFNFTPQSTQFSFDISQP